MNLVKKLEEINKSRDRLEASWVFSLWEDPQLYEDYMTILDNKKNKFLSNKDAIFYFNLGKALYKNGFRTFDVVTVENFLSGKPEAKKKYEEYGGWKTISDMKELIDNTDNERAYFDQISKLNYLSNIAEKYEDVFENLPKLKDASVEDAYNIFDAINTQVSISATNSSQVEDLIIDDAFLQRCRDQQEQGLSYWSAAPILNYLTLGSPLGDIYMIAGTSGSGKTSFVFENMVIPFALNGNIVGIISNEMKIDAYKHLLLIHILTHDLDYWDLNRKKLKQGKFSEEDERMLSKAQEISREKYKNIKFVKLFENNAGSTIRYIKRLKSQGAKAIIWDTMKSDDGMDEKMWQQLLMNSRKIFNVVSKENLAMIVTFQVAIHTINQRFLEASCLANSRQVKEVVSELVMMRKLWADEYTGGKYDCKPYKFNKDNNKIKESIDLDPEKNYIVVFLDKTRNDETGKQVLFQWDGHYNRWKEIGYCTIINEHRSY